MSYAYYHFEEIMKEFERHAATIWRIGTFRYSLDPTAPRADVLPLPSDFLCDVELSCKVALAKHPRLWALWRGVFLYKILDKQRMRTKFPKECDHLAELCGRILCCTIPHIGAYFNVTDKHIEEAEKESIARWAAIEALQKLRDTPAARKAERHRQKNANRRKRYRELKRNQRRREKYAKMKAEMTIKERKAA